MAVRLGDVGVVKVRSWGLGVALLVVCAALPVCALDAAAAEPADGSLVTYVAFDKSTHRLRQLNGVYTATLMTDADLARYGEARARDLIDRYDLLYAHYVELMGREPGGTGLLHVAFVNTCGGGCGYIGSRGIELEPASLGPQAAPGTDGAYTYAVHEMAHNFDFYSSFIMYGPDVAHAWTDFMNPYVKFYDQGGLLGLSPTEWVQDGVDRYFEPYATYPGRTWRKCVRDNACAPQQAMAQHAQGGALLRLAQVHGPQAVKRMIRHLRDAVAQRALDAKAMTVRQKNDLLIESMSFGAGQNLACFFDTIAWPVSAALRADLDRRFGANPSCADADHDGYTPYGGDCNDASATVHPGGVELANGIDDDCNGAVDDLTIVENGDFPNTPANPWLVSIPSHLSGRLSSSADGDDFALDLAAQTDVELSLRSVDGFAGWLFLYEQGTGNWRKYVHAGAGEEVVLQDTLGPGRWNFNVEYNTLSNPGAYQLSVARVKHWLGEFATPGGFPGPGASYTLVAPAVPSQVRSRTVRKVRFWVSRVGFVGSASASAATTSQLTWTPPVGVDPSQLSYRVEFLSGAIPATPTSEAASLTAGAR